MGSIDDLENTVLMNVMNENLDFLRAGWVETC